MIDMNEEQKRLATQGWVCTWLVVAILFAVKIAANPEMHWSIVFAPVWCTFAIGGLNLALILIERLWEYLSN